MPRWGSHLLALGAGIGLGALLVIAYREGQAAPEENAGGPRRVDLSVAEGESYRVRRVIDGDTVALENGLHVRYAGINTPELGRWIKEAAPLALKAKARNAEWVEGRRVKLTFGSTPMDAYGRLVARVRVEDGAGGWRDVEAALIEEGLGRVMGMSLPGEVYEALKARQASAKKKRRGLWGLPHPLEKGNPQGFRYCAAANSEVFHPVEAPTARRIGAANFIGFKTLQQARASGRSLGKRYRTGRER